MFVISDPSSDMNLVDPKIETTDLRKVVETESGILFGIYIAIIDPDNWSRAVNTNL